VVYEKYADDAAFKKHGENLRERRGLRGRARRPPPS
jgi:hypothetical protein